MKNRERPEFVHSRRMFIQDALDEFIDAKDVNAFLCLAFCVIEKVGLQLDAEEENLFNSEE